MKGIEKFKSHQEFFGLDMDQGWEVPPGYPSGIEQKILAGHLDEDRKRGNRTRFLRFQPGAYTSTPFIHEYWEEVVLITGDLVVVDATGNGADTVFEPYTYACRPPGVYHGPFKSAGGCLLLELHCYDAENANE